jgi:hypothetical protein
MITNKIIINKFYKLEGKIVKIRKITKSANRIYVTRLDNDSEVIVPMEHSDLILHRIYTIGEVAKIVEKRTDTIRKYEKRNLIPASKKFGEKYQSYENWRYYEHKDVYDMVSFFTGRTPGRPPVKTVPQRIVSINQRVKLGKAKQWRASLKAKQ